MSNVVKKIPAQNTEGYCPKDKPVIISLAEEMRNRKGYEEILVEQINEECSIVDRSQIKVVGIQVMMTPSSDLDAISMVKKYIKDGTCKLLEDLLCVVKKGKYIAVASEIKSGIEFMYTIGVEVESFENLPEFLPPNTVKLVCPPARYGKVVRNPENNEDKYAAPKQAICYLSSAEFRNATDYVYDVKSMPFREFDEKGELITAYEPVIQTKNEEDKFQQVGHEVVMLPELKVAGCAGDNGMWDMFGIENDIDWKNAGCLNEHQYYSFAFVDGNGNKSNIFGRLVSDFENTPANLERGVMPTGLWVKFYQKQINNDDPSIFFEGVKELFFKNHPNLQEDYSTRSGLYIAQYEQGASFYFPVKREES